MDLHHSTLPESAAQAILAHIASGSQIQSIRAVTGEYYNRNFYLDARTPAGEDLRCVVKLYQGDPAYAVVLVRTEYQALRWLYANHRPVPEPLYMDDTGALVGGPLLVTRFLPGVPVDQPPYPAEWGKHMARALASLHAIPYDPATQTFLRDANENALWFRRAGGIPAWLAKDPDGPAIWDAIEALLPLQEKVTPRLTHTDFWGGNVLFHEGQITAVLDWGEAGYGDPAKDAAYTYLDLQQCGLKQDMADFLSTYEAETGEPLANFTLWKLAAAVRPIRMPEGWIDREPYDERFREFVRQTLEEVKTLNHKGHKGAQRTQRKDF